MSTPTPITPETPPQDTPTPRTDAKVAEMIKLNQSPDGLEFFARALERELVAAKIDQSRANATWLTTLDALVASRAECSRLGVEAGRLREALDVLEAAPELNMSNYDHEQVRQLNDAAIEATQLLRAALDRKGTT